MKNNAILSTDFQIPGLKKIFTGKVRDVYEYTHKNKVYLIVVVTDRISAFDVVLPVGIPYKGAVLNEIASKFLDMADEEGIETWKIDKIHPMVTVGLKAEPIMVEMIARELLTGSLWRLYKEGVREICGITLPDGMQEWDVFADGPIITPTTKAENGHDENISPEEIVRKGLTDKSTYDLMDVQTDSLFCMGAEFAEKMGLILVDTKYEFGLIDGKLILIDEIHTPDSSRYLYMEGFEESLKEGKVPKSLDKEFLRQWLISQGFKGEDGQEVPEMSAEFIQQVSDRYLELYANIMGEKLEQTEYSLEEIETSIMDFIQGLKDMEEPEKMPEMSEE
ncbi:MAG: phosphoribosylaminoimidazolesuccinocarboxamide synthase [candidate division SR1 bacterium]|nr:phosphoribosylaminoimidazolesuccinocarboxamide synthase [candidate division SR1 bacterium]